MTCVVHPIMEGLRAVVPLGAGGLQDSWTSIDHQSMLGSGRKQAFIPARVSISGVGLVTAVGEGGQIKLNSFSFGSLYIWATTRRGHLLYPSVNPPRKYTPRPAKKPVS